ncbi:outer membrane protein assembly factor BamA [Rhodobacteraceae bacterium GS-10]|uniref:Outer membrane protein assembly factor BamA n=2 Tax=Thalassovita mangrovi TaxID=2692236 RepID=A0A6L8LE44_9RHOB|nr:outer membrane protein assembly factor BamA [Thalassovita mangrovi]
MTDFIKGRRGVRASTANGLSRMGTAFFLSISTALIALPDVSAAQDYTFGSVVIQGNQRIEAGTILTYAGIERGKAVSAGELNAAYQRILASGLFETVEITPRGGTLVIDVKEYPTINQISIEGNRRVKDEDLQPLLQSKSRLVFNPKVAERDAAIIAEVYNQQGRLSATVSPKIIRRSDNRVDLIFEVFEGGITEIERISFVGNKAYSDRRLRSVLQTKQAGLLRALIKRDTFVEDRISFDKQVLSDFYLSRGYVDFRTTGVNAELTRERDGYFITFNIEEGQQFRVGKITTSSDLADVDADEFQKALKMRSGMIYSPTVVENSIARMERLANRKGLNFVRVEPRITRNDRDLTLDVEFVLSRGPRVFVERIDIEGNTTTMDRVIRQQFKIVEGDPFNPREIRESAERIRALGFFSNADVKAREGSNPDQVIVDVNVEEQPTGSLSFGGTYSTNTGFGLLVTMKEDNFLGRGQRLNLSLSGAEDNQVYALGFSEPALLGRNLRFDLDIGYRETQTSYANYDTTSIQFRPGITFPVSDNGRLKLYYNAESIEMIDDGSAVFGGIVGNEIAQGNVWSSSLGYSYSYDTRRTGLNPNAGVLFEFGQEFAGVGGDVTFSKTTAKAIAQTKILNEEVTLRASLEGGLLDYTSGVSRSVDRYQIGSGLMRGFSPDGIGPREIVYDSNGDEVSNDALGGDMFAVARFEAEFPLGLPEEYGIRGGLFYDVGSVWGLTDASAATGSVFYEDFSLRHVVGVSLFWNTPVGPLRFNWSKALQKEDEDIEQTFNLTVSTEF